jgi:serine/threonine protein kinase/predicted TPR repeat methyltransferase
VTSPAENCIICGQPKSSSMTGSFTQWVSACRCGELERGKEQMPICALCGKQIDKGNTGSFTQWVLESQNCSCESPVPLDANMASSKTFALRDDTSRQPKTVEEEISDLDADTFPLDRYRPIDKLGSGGGGAVFLCFDKHLKKNVAVKISYAKLSDELINFQAEAKVTAKFQHPNIVSIIDFGLTPAGSPFMVLEHVDGVSLDKYIEESGHVDEHTAIQIFIQVASAIDKGHEFGIFHRDIKSSNVLITHEGKKGTIFARVIDFGIAMMTGQETTKFHGKNIIGTPKYMSPDQLLGRTFDARSEIYSFGCVMFETLTGSLPFKGDPMTLLDMHTKVLPPTFHEVAPDVHVSRSIERLVMRCLEKDPDLRFSTMKELKTALEHLEPDEIVEASSIQTAINPLLFPTSLTRTQSIGESVDETSARRLAFEKENRRRALTDEISIPTQQTQIGQNHEAATAKGKEKKSQLVIALLAAGLVGMLGIFAAGGYMILNQDGEPESKRAKSKTPKKLSLSTTDGANSDVLASINDLDLLTEKVAKAEELFQFKELENLYSRMIELSPNSTEYYRMRGIARKHQGRYSAALSDFDQALKMHEADSDSLRARAEYFFDCGKYVQAMKDINFALELQPNKVSNLLIKAQIMLATNAPLIEVEKVLNHALDYSPSSGFAHALRAKIYTQMDRPEDAQREINLLALETTNDARVFYYRAVLVSNTNAPDKDNFANLYISNAIKLAPYMWQAYLARAKMYAEKKGEKEQALEDFRKAMSLNPMNSEILFSAASYYQQIDQLEQALKTIDNALALEPKGKYYEFRGNLNIHSGKHMEAEKDFEDAIKAGENGPPVYRSYASALVSLKKYEEAETAFNKAISANPKYLAALFQRAQLYEKMNQDKNALADYSTVLKLQPTDQLCRLHRAELYERLGMKVPAARDRAQLPKVADFFAHYKDTKSDVSIDPLKQPLLRNAFAVDRN